MAHHGRAIKEGKSAIILYFNNLEYGKSITWPKKVQAGRHAISK